MPPRALFYQPSGETVKIKAGLQNPVLIAGFDILFLGKKGFSSLANALTIKVRPKGDKNAPWITINVSRKKSEAQKRKALDKVLQKESFSRDAEPEKKKRIKKEKKELAADEIQFDLVKSTSKMITDKRGHKLEILKLVYEVPKAINFVQGRDFKFTSMQLYINAVKREFKKIQKQYGKTSYFVRLHHQYKGLPSNFQIDPEEKGFGGYALHRQEFHSEAAINEQFDGILPTFYPESFSRYLRFASDQTNFDFIGFMVEVTLERARIPFREPDRRIVVERAKTKKSFTVTVAKKPKKRKKSNGKGRTKLARSPRSKKRS